MVSTELLDKPLDISKNLTEYSCEKAVSEEIRNKLRCKTKFFKVTLVRLANLLNSKMR